MTEEERAEERQQEEDDREIAMPAPVELAAISIRELEARVSELRRAVAQKRRAAIELEQKRVGWFPMRGRVVRESSGPSRSDVLLLQADTLAAELEDVLAELRDRRDAEAKAGERRRMWLTITVAAIATAGTLVQAWAVYRPPLAAVEVSSASAPTTEPAPSAPSAVECDPQDLLTGFLCGGGPSSIAPAK
jgi:hypothetical protein